MVELFFLKLQILRFLFVLHLQFKSLIRAIQEDLHALGIVIIHFFKSHSHTWRGTVTKNDLYMK